MNALPTTCEVCDYPSTVRVHDGCRERLDGRLKALPGAWRALALWLVPSPAGDHHGTRTRDEAPLPVRLNVLDLRARGGIERLAEWERDARELLHWPPPPFRGSIEQAVTGTVAFLRANLLWLCDQHPGIRDLDREVAEITASIASVVDPIEPADRPRRLGYCPTPLDGGPCGAVVTLRPGAATATCRWCRADYPPDTWLALRAAQIQEAC